MPIAPPASPSEYTRYFAQVSGLRESTRAAMRSLIGAREAALMPHFEPAVVLQAVSEFVSAPLPAPRLPAARS